MLCRWIRSLRRLVQYRLLSRRYPSRVEFVDMGLGIEARYERCRAAWEGHLTQCRALERQFLIARERCESLLILGAGRLLDVDLEAVAATCKRITLLDADPSVRPYWRRAARSLGRTVHLETVLLDSTRLYDTFLQGLTELCKGSPGTGETVRWLNGLAPSKDWPLAERFEAVWSLNLIGQIPIYFRDRLISDLARARKVPEEEVMTQDAELAAAFSRFEDRLRRQHLGQLARSRAARLLLLGDLRFSYYDSKGAILENVEVLECAPEISGYRRVQAATWQWDIAPPKQDGAEYGIRHDVGGWVFEKRGGA